MTESLNTPTPDRPFDKQGDPVEYHGPTAKRIKPVEGRWIITRKTSALYF